MPPQVAQSKLLAKYGAKLNTAVASHANDETDYGFIRIPGGISNGIAQLSKCYFKDYQQGPQKGEYYLRMEGVVIQPEYVTLKDGSEMKVQGLTTSVMIPVCDTKGWDKEGKEIVIPQSENIKKVLNEFRKLAGEDFTKGATGATLETLAAALQQAKPFFRFSTTESKPREYIDRQTGQKKMTTPKVYENWFGNKGLESYTPNGDAGSGVDDTSEHVDESTVAESTGHEATNGQTASSLATGDYTDQGDLDSLVERAEAGDIDARNALTEMANNAGLGKEADDAKTWTDVGNLLRGSTKETEPEPEVKPTPKKGDIVDYKPKDKNGKPSAKAIKVEVVAVNEKNRTADVKSKVDNKAIFKGVKFDELD